LVAVAALLAVIIGLEGFFRQAALTGGDLAAEELGGGEAGAVTTTIAPRPDPDGWVTVGAQRQEDTEMAERRSYRGNIRAPEFPPDLEWLNTGRRLTLAELRGKFVLLDFWTYGCINCIHIIPDLKKLEAEFPDELVVIGVHSAKFENEGDVENIRRIILRYDLEHPVVNDHEFDVWQRYAVRAWPTTILVDPRGRVIASHSGEGVYDKYHEFLAEAVADYDEQGLLDRSPMAFELEEGNVPRTALSFPGKVLADAVGGRLFVADSNHNRLVITDLDGEVLEVIGTGARGLVDGPYDQAAFSKPQGMALDGDILYVADTENHALRAVDLAAGTVRTLAGDGTQGRYYPGTQGENVIRLNSPWDLTLVGRRLYIAMAGNHQLWVLDLDARQIGPYAGTGREALLDGPLNSAAFNQPSGITHDGESLYVADSEASAVRRVALDPEGNVETIIGEGLFEFGDVDGTYPQARLQHPLGIVHHSGVLFVADTYNHKIKLIEPSEQRATTYAGGGQPGWRDGERAQFYEPGGLSVANNRLYVADTNNHVIRVIDLNTAVARTLPVSDPQGLLVRLEGDESRPLERLPEQRVQPGKGVIRLDIEFPEGYELNELADSRLVWEQVPRQTVRLAGDIRAIALAERSFPLEIEATFREGRGSLIANVALYYCRSRESVCLIHLAELEVPVLVTEEAQSTAVDLTVRPQPGE
jgi:thiol-disulfide isomerase/thioredoxin